MSVCTQRQTRHTSVLSQPILDNSPGGASLLHPNAAAALGTPGLAALLVAYILPVCALLAPCQPGAALRIIGNSWLGQDTRKNEAAMMRAAAELIGQGRRNAPLG